MIRQCTRSSKFSNLENYKGFFPSFAEDQLEVSTDLSTGETSDRSADLVEAKGDRTKSGRLVVRLTEQTTKETIKSSPDVSEGNGNGNGIGSGSGSGSGGGSSGGDSTRCPGTRHRVLRKAKTPRPSARKNDPRFRGVTFCVETQICREKRDRSQLNIRSFYSIKKKLSQDHEGQVKTKRRKPSVVSSTSGSDETDTRVEQRVEIPYAGIAYGSKQCASCLTRRTPLWRDAENGTPLCNACGIRYKKYHIRCIACWHIPKKDGKSSSQVCSRCGNALRLAIPKRFFL